MRAQLREARAQLETANATAHHYYATMTAVQATAEDYKRAADIRWEYQREQQRAVLDAAQVRIKDALILIERYEDPSVNSLDAAELFTELRLRLTGMSTTTHTRDSLQHVLTECQDWMRKINQTVDMNGYAYLERIKQHIQDLLNG